MVFTGSIPRSADGLEWYASLEAMTCPLCLLPCPGDSEVFLAADEVVVVVAEIDLYPVDPAGKTACGGGVSGVTEVPDPSGTRRCWR